MENPLLVDTGRGFSIQYKGRWLYSRRDPRAAPQAAAERAAMLPDTLYVIPSPCLCYGLRELLARLPDSSAALCVEAEEPLMAAAIEAAGLDSRLALSSPGEALSAYRRLESADPARRFRRAVELRLSGGWTLHEDLYGRTLAAINADISTRFRNRLSLVRMGRLWTRNVLSNLGTMRWESVAPLCAEGRPIVVCGAGTSLDAAIPEIRRCRKDVFILACDTAAGALSAAGVPVDAVVCLEGQIYNLEDFLPLGGTSPSLVADLSAHPSSFRAIPTGRVTLTLSEWTDSAFLGRLRRAGLPVTVVPPLGSVGVLAVRLASMLGGPVIAAGLDFAFPRGRTHCAGSPTDLRARRSETRLEKRSAAWASSFRAGCSRGAGDAVTDPALTMYAALAASELRAVGGYDLRGGFGAPLPLRPMPPGGLEEIAAARDDGGRSAPIVGEAVDAETCRARVSAFLGGELAMVEAVSEALRGGADEDGLRALLAEADFLYAHFPDPERVMALEDDALRRVAAETAYWRGRLAAALQS